MLVFTLASTLALAQPGSTKEYLARFRHFSALIGTAASDEANAVGESLVRDAVIPQDKVFMPATLAVTYSGANAWQRRRELIEQADEASRKWVFRSMPDSGELGYWKYRSLSQLEVAKCVQATLHGRNDESHRACSEGMNHAVQAAKLVHWTSVRRETAELQLASAHLFKARGDVRAGRQLEADQSIAIASEIIARYPVSSGRRWHFYRTAAILRLSQRRPLEAVALAREAVAIYEGSGSFPITPQLADSRSLVRQGLVAARRWDEALAAFELEDRSLGKLSPWSLEARAVTWAHFGRLAELVPVLDTEARQRRLERGAGNLETLMMEGLAGAALVAESGTRAIGLQRLRDATEGLAVASMHADPMLAEGVNEQVVRLVMEQYLRYFGEHVPRSPEEVTLAFRVAEALRGSRVQQAITDAAIRSAAERSGLGELVRSEQDARHESRALQEIIARREVDRDPATRDATFEKVRARLRELDVEQSRLRALVRQSFPEYDALVRPQMPAPGDVARYLVDGDVFVSLLPSDEGVHVWAISGGGTTTYRLVPIALKQLNRMVEAIRRSTELDPGPAKPFATGVAAQLYADLLAPLEPQLAGARHLIVASAGVFGQLPFAALLTAPWDDKSPTPPPWLARRLAISHVPSAAAWLAVKAVAPVRLAGEPLLAWGDPHFGAEPMGGSEPVSRKLLARQASFVDSAGLVAPPAALRYADIPPLPETRDELRAIAATLKGDPERELRFGRAATRESVLAASKSGELARKRVVAFATHGLMAGELPNLNQPALALAATPNADKDPLAPLLKLDDVLGLAMNADWVVLSACNTAAADDRGQEALSGLARGFFYAGARSMLVTHWAVESQSAKLLTTATFEHYAANPRAGKAESLRRAMLEVMSSRKYAHPAYWAPYVLVGEGNR